LGGSGTFLAVYGVVFLLRFLLLDQLFRRGETSAASDAVGPVSAKDIAKVVGEPVACTIPSDYRVAAEAINVGRPIVGEDGRLAKALRAAAAELVNVGKTAAEPQPAGMLSRLAWRRA